MLQRYFSEVGKKSSVSLKLIYKYHIEVAETLADHNYSNVPLFNPTVIDIDLNKSTKIQSYIEKQYMHPSPEKGNTNISDEKTTTDKIIMQNELQINIVNSCTVYEGLSNIPSHNEINNKLDSKEKIIKIDLSFLEAPKSYGDNYENVSQNTQKWLDLRRNKVTGSRLPALLGFYGKSKFDSIWSIVRNGKSEECFTHIRNIVRGPPL